jgi:uncharacterized protein
MAEPTSRFLGRYLRGLARLIYERPGAILLLALAGTVLSILITVARFKVVNNISDLLNENSPENRAYLSYKKEFGVDEEYITVIHSDDPELNRKVADEVAVRLREIGPGIGKIFYKLDFSKLEKRFLLFENEADLKQIEDQVGGYAKALQKRSIKMDLNSMLDEANRSFDDKYLRKSSNWKEFMPFVDRFSEMLNQLANEISSKDSPPKKMASPAPGNENAQILGSADLDKLITEHEYPASFNEGRTILVMATPGVREKDSESPYSRTLAKIRENLAELKQKYPGVSFGLTGEPVLNDDEMQTAKRDTIQASIITLILITTLFAVSYRDRQRPAYAIVVLLMSVAWSFAFTMLTVGHLNIISQAFVPMAMGLGIDFGIQLLGRYEEELGRGRSVLQSLEETLGHTGVAVLTGGSTTAVAFFTMCFNDFIGLRELGIICGGSILCCLIGNIIVLPSVFAWRDKSRSPAELQPRTGAAVDLGFLGKNLNENWVKHPYALIGVGCAISVLAALGINKIAFDYNLLHLQSRNLESVKVENQLFKEAGTSSIYASSTVNNLDEARARTEQFMKLPSVKEVQSIADVMPQNQQQKQAIIKRIVHSLQGLKLDTDVTKQVDVNKARANTATLLQQAREGEKQARNYIGISKIARDAVDTFARLIPPLERAQSAMQGLTQEELGRRLNRYQVTTFGSMQKNLTWLKSQQTDRGITDDDIPKELRDRFVGKSGKLLLQVYAKGDLWEHEPLGEFVNQLRTIDPDVTGTPTQNYAYIDLLRRSYMKAALWAFVAIVVLIAIHFRSPRYATLAILPLALACLWTVGLMGWTGIQFNPANIMTLPMVIGIGVAFGVYTADRLREDGRMTLFSTSTGKAVILSTLTTTFGFASMLGSHYEGLFSLGLVMTIGVLMCLLTSIVFLPQIFTVITPNAAPPRQPETGRTREPVAP